MSRYNSFPTLDGFLGESRQRVSALENGPNDSWHEVGDSNEPAFANSWVNFAGGDAPARFYKDASGQIHLGGLVKNGTVGSAIFTLPTGYRPAYTLRFPCLANGALATVIVTVDGEVYESAGGSNTWLDLSPISFRVEG